MIAAIRTDVHYEGMTTRKHNEDEESGRDRVKHQVYKKYRLDATHKALDVTPVHLSIAHRTHAPSLSSPLLFIISFTASSHLVISLPQQTYLYLAVPSFPSICGPRTVPCRAISRMILRAGIYDLV